jgi:hypothetical protein
VDTPLEIFFSYAHEDEALMTDVRRQLVVYERNGRILKWHDRMIPPGSEWRVGIDARLETARVILLFMSPHFIESRYCYEVEGYAALQRHQTGHAKVIPIILRPCAWHETPFGNLQALPTDGKPITRWRDRDEACLDAATGVMKAVDELTTANLFSSAPVQSTVAPRRLKTRGEMYDSPVWASFTDVSLNLILVLFLYLFVLASFSAQEHGLIDTFVTTGVLRAAAYAATGLAVVTVVAIAAIEIFRRRRR